MQETFNIQFWGVRGSYPTPGNTTVLYGGNTACVQVTADGQTIILDAGTGIIPLGRVLARQAQKSGRGVQATILFSHLHHDHTQGFPFFAPAYHPAARLHLFGPGASQQALEELLSRNQMPPAFPVSLRDMNAAKEIQSLNETDVISFEDGLPRLAKPTDPNALQIRLMKSYAHPGGVYIYKISWRGYSVVYATDTEGYIGTDRRLAAFAKNADLLIHDAQYSEAHYRGLEGWSATQGFGHSTPQMACELAAAAQVERLALFHHDPNYDDATLAKLETEASQTFAGAFAAKEGEYVQLGAGQMPLAAATKPQPGMVGAFSPRKKDVQ